MERKILFQGVRVEGNTETFKAVLDEKQIGCIQVVTNMRQKGVPPNMELKFWTTDADGRPDEKKAWCYLQSIIVTDVDENGACEMDWLYEMLLLALSKKYGKIDGFSQLACVRHVVMKE